MPSLQQLALAALTRGEDGGWRLEPPQAAQLTAHIDGQTRASRAGIEGLRPVLKLIVALERDAKSQPAAQALVQALRDAPAAYAVLREHKLGAGTRGRRDAARLGAFEGRRAVSQAPMHDAPTPQGTLPARQLMRPLDKDAARARKKK